MATAAHAWSHVEMAYRHLKQKEPALAAEQLRAAADELDKLAGSERMDRDREKAGKAMQRVMKGEG